MPTYVNANEKCRIKVSINKDVYEKFRDNCKQINLPMTTVLEMFCKDFADKKFDVDFSCGILWVKNER